MTSWGAFLLCSYIALGASSRVSRRQAGRLALVVTAVVVAIAMVSYTHSTPTDKYYRDVDSTVYATGQPAPALDQNTATTEDETGVQAATLGNTVLGTIGTGGGS